MYNNVQLTYGTQQSLQQPRQEPKEAPIDDLNFRSISAIVYQIKRVKKGKAVPLQAWGGPENSRKLRFPDFMTTAQDGGKVVSLTHRPALLPENTPGTHFCERLSRLQDHSVTGRFMSLKNSNDAIGNRTHDLPVCSVVP